MRATTRVTMRATTRATTSSERRVPTTGQDPRREIDRLALTIPQRIATVLVAVALLTLGAGGMLVSRLSGGQAGSLPLVAVMVAAFGGMLLLVALRGRTFSWLPARAPAMLPQLVLAIGAVTLVAVGHGVATVRTDAVGRAIGWGGMALALVLVVVAVVRRWVPRVGDGLGHRDER